jgi:hypothetical protein
VAGSSEFGNELSSSVKDREITDWLSDCFSRRTVPYGSTYIVNHLCSLYLCKFHPNVWKIFSLYHPGCERNNALHFDLE